MNIKVQDGNMIFINLFEVILMNILILSLPFRFEGAENVKLHKRDNLEIKVKQC